MAHTIVKIPLPNILPTGVCSPTITDQQRLIFTQDANTQVNLRTTLLCHMPEPPETLSCHRELPFPKAINTLISKSFSYSLGLSSCAFSGSTEYLLQRLYTLPTSAVYLAMKNSRHCCTLDCSSYSVLHEKQSSCTQKN